MSYWQWHPFTLTSAPEEDYISVHMSEPRVSLRCLAAELFDAGCVGDFTTALARALGCDLPTDKSEAQAGAAIVTPQLNRVLPRLMVSLLAHSSLSGS